MQDAVESLIDQGQSLRQELERQQEVEEEEGTGQGADPVGRLLRWGATGRRLPLPAGRAACANLLRASASAGWLQWRPTYLVPRSLESKSGCRAAESTQGPPPRMGGSTSLAAARARQAVRSWGGVACRAAEVGQGAGHRGGGTGGGEQEGGGARLPPGAGGAAPAGWVGSALAGMVQCTCGWLGEAWGVRGRDVACWWEGAFGRLHVLRA